MEDVFKQLQLRFPLLTRLGLQDSSKDLRPQVMPAYLGIFLAALETSVDPPICFILPRHGDVARLSAVLFAMHQLVRKQKELIHGYAESSFNVGDFVRIHPGRHVFKYGGYDANCPDRIWLLTADDNGRWQVPAAKVVSRLEKTTIARPVGKLNSPILSPPHTLLDSLLGTSFCGNLSLVTNEVLILDSVSGFEDFVEICQFSAAQQIANAAAVKALLPFGSLVEPDAGQWFRKWDDSGGIGEPIVAVTHSADLLANYCIDVPVKSKLVVVNGLGHLRHLQAYDDISQTQRLILFADHDNEELIDALGKRGCRFWLLGERELLAGATESARTGILGSITRWARNYEDLSVDDEPCEDGKLDEVFLTLDKFRGAASRSDETFARVLYSVWGLFLNASSVWAVPSEDERRKFLESVDVFRKDVRSNSAWFSPDDVAILNRIADGLADCYEGNTRLGFVKGAALLRVIDQAKQESSRVAVLVRNETKVEELRQWLSQQSALNNVEVFSPRTLPIHEPFDRVICVFWPGREAMKQVVSKLAAPRITVVGYPCECRWLRQFQPTIKRNMPIPSLSGDEKIVLLGGDQHPIRQWQEEVETCETTASESAELFSIWDLERRLRFGRIGLAVKATNATDTLPARYVRFSGDCYAFITETHKLAVATDMISARDHHNVKLPERTLPDIRPGDFIVFPETGDRELIHELADKLIGSAALQLRNVARLWKDTLRSSGLTPTEFLHLAKALNRPRHRLTIRNWFADVSQIGPREKDDLILIAIITKDERLERELDGVWSAIEQLRSAHLSAGMRLRDALLNRLPKVVGQVEENGTRVELGDLGSAWIVRVEVIEAEMEQRGRGEVNRLLFEKDSVDLSDLLGELV